MENREADEESRTKNDDTEWTLRSEIFTEILQTYPEITVDIFASRLNNQTESYIARRPDPNAFAIGSFTITWSHDVYFIFAPFSLLGQDPAKSGGGQFRSSAGSTHLAIHCTKRERISVSSRCNDVTTVTNIFGQPSLDGLAYFD